MYDEVRLDAAANAHNGPRISTADSRVSVWLIPTDEELMIAQHTLALVRPELDKNAGSARTKTAQPQLT